MFAVIKTGGKQYRVSKDDVLEIELLDGNVGDTVSFNEVLAAGEGDSIEIGAPTVSKVVEGKIVAQTKGEKLLKMYHRRRKNSKKKTGHRQKYTMVQITEIKSA